MAKWFKRGGTPVSPPSSVRAYLSLGRYSTLGNLALTDATVESEHDETLLIGCNFVRCNLVRFMGRIESCLLIDCMLPSTPRHPSNFYTTTKGATDEQGS